MVDTSSSVREFFVNNIKARFAQSRLSAGDAVAGFDVATVGGIEAFLDGLYIQLADVVLLASGEGALQFFKQNRSAVITDLQAGKVEMGGGGHRLDANSFLEMLFGLGEVSQTFVCNAKILMHVVEVGVDLQ